MVAARPISTGTSPALESGKHHEAFAPLKSLWDATFVARLLLFRSRSQYRARSLLGGIPMSDKISLKELVEFVSRALVDHPDQVEVAEIAGEQTIVLELKVAKEDLGKVIGKQGRTVKAMRSILNAASSKLRKRADLEILE